MDDQVPEERVFASGFSFPEGPSFDNDGNLFVAELGAGRVSKIAPDGTWEVFATLGDSPNATAIGPDGHIYVCNNGGWWAPETSTGGVPGKGGGTPCIQKLTPTGDAEVLITEIDGVALNSPNDLVFDAHGGFYFTDPIWPDEEGKIQTGSICYSDTSGNARRIHTGIFYPNGLGVDADGTKLLINESGTARVVAFDIDAPGVISNERSFGWVGLGTVPDGMCFDSTGRVLVCGHGAGAVYVLEPEGGCFVQRIPISDKDVTNICFGGPDYSTLFMTGSDHGQILTMEWDVPGMPLPGGS